MRNFTASAVVEWVHALPHYDSGLKKVDNTFDPDSHTYLQSLAMFGAPFYAIALLSLAFFVLRSLLKRCKRCCWQDKRRVFSHRRAVVMGVVVLVVFAACMVASFVLNQQVGAACEDVGDSLDTLVDMRDHTVDTANAIVRELDGVTSESVSLAPDCRSLVAKGVSEGATLLRSLQSIGSVCSNSSQTISHTVSQVNEYDMAQYAHDAHHYNRLRGNAQLGVLGFMVFPLVLLLLAIPFKAVILLLGTGWVAVIVGVLAWILVGLGSSACVGAADFCIDPNAFIETKTHESSTTVQQYVRYYTQCYPSSTNPVETDIDQGRSNVHTAQSVVHSALAYCASLSQDYIQQHNISVEIDALTSGFTAMNHTLEHTQGSINSLDDAMQCANFNPHYVDALFSVCDGGLDALGALLVCQLLIGLLCFVAFFVARNFRHIFRPNIPTERHSSRVLEVQLLREDENVFGVEEEPEQGLEALSFEAMQARHSGK